jgi:hypothetical protein
MAGGIRRFVEEALDGWAGAPAAADRLDLPGGGFEMDIRHRFSSP